MQMKVSFAYKEIKSFLILVIGNLNHAHLGNLIFKYYNHSPLGTHLILISKSFDVQSFSETLKNILITNQITITLVIY